MIYKQRKRYDFREPNRNFSVSHSITTWVKKNVAIDTPLVSRNML